MAGWPKCHECEATEPYYINTQKRWKCRNCRIQFSVKRGAIFEDSPISLTKWLPALWLIVNCQNGISSYEVSRDFGVTQKTAWFMLQRLRLVMKAKDMGTKLGSNGGGEVEVGESFIGGKLKNMHRSRANRLNSVRASSVADRSEYMTRYQNKTPVLGILDRESRKVRAKVIPNVKRVTLQNEILSNVKYGSSVYTDQAVGYDSLKRKYVHDTVNHAEIYAAINLPPDRFAGVRRSGVQFGQEVSVPTGAAFLRIGIRDVTADKVGAVDLPLSP